MASRLDRIPGKKQRVMTVRRPLSSPESSAPSCPRSILFPQPLFPVEPSCRAPYVGEGGLNSERGGKKPFWASGEARGAIKRGRVGPEPGCSRVLTVVTRRLMRPTRRGPRVGRLSSRKPVKSMPEIYERPAASWIRELPTDPSCGSFRPVLSHFSAS